MYMFFSKPETLHRVNTLYTCIAFLHIEESICRVDLFGHRNGCIVDL